MSEGKKDKLSSLLSDMNAKFVSHRAIHNSGQSLRKVASTGRQESVKTFAVKLVAKK